MISYIEINGVKSTDFGMKIYNNLEFASSIPDVAEIIVPGRHGTLDIDNNRLHDIEKTIQFDMIVNGEVEGGWDGSAMFNQVQKVSEWLNLKGYQEVRFSMYQGYYFKAKIRDPYGIEDTMRRFGRGTLRLAIYPIMYKDEEMIVDASNGASIDNTEPMDSKPYIVIESTSPSLKIMNNDKIWISLQNLEGKIVIDSELMQVFDDFGSASDKMLRVSPLFPVLYKGVNNIAVIEGELTSMTITPRLCRRAII